MTPRFAIQDLLWLLLVVVLLCTWWMQNSRLRHRLHWANLRADTNDGAIWEICKAFEREEDYTCDLFEVPTDYGTFYSGVNVIRPTDSSFHVNLPGEKYRHLSVYLRNQSDSTPSDSN